MRDLTLFNSIKCDLNDKNFKFVSFDDATRTLYTLNDSILVGIDVDNGKVNI